MDKTEIKKIREILGKQLQLLSNASEQTDDIALLYDISQTMLYIIKTMGYWAATCDEMLRDGGGSG